MSDNQWEGTEFDKPRTVPQAPDKMPEDIEAEKTFLSTCCAIGQKHIAAEFTAQVTEDAFVHPAHRIVYQAIRALLAEDAEISSITLKATIEKMGKLNQVGGFVGIVELLAFDDSGDPAKIVSILNEKLALRRLIALGGQIIEKAASGMSDPIEVLSVASEGITRLASGTNDKHLITDMTDLLDDLAEGKAITTEHGGMAMSWGDDTLDRICPIPRGEPTIVCARPGCGKSAMAIQVIVSTVEKGLGKPLFLSLEMGREKVKARLAAHLSEVNSRAFRDGQYDSGAIEKILHRKHILSGFKTMFPKQQCKVEEIEALVKHAVDVHGITCVVLDQFSHVAPPREAGKESYAIANAQTSKHLTALAKNLNLGWVTLAQINKDGDDNRRPTMKDLAATDRLVQDAAVIFGLWNKGTDENQEVWGTLMKTRDEGWKGWAKQLAADYGTCTFKVQEYQTEARTFRF